MGYGTDGVTFNALRGANLARLPQFKNPKGERAHTEDDGSDWSLSDWALAVTGELGEACNLIKKVNRGDFTLDDARQDIADELADVQIYLDILAMRAGVDLGRAVQRKFNLTSEKVGSTVRISGSDWHHERQP
jgi:NTP pyrophosphatase (non-canonical NTP hydrolase)